MLTSQIATLDHSVDAVAAPGSWEVQEMASNRICAVACAGGTGDSYGCCEGWGKDQHRTLPRDIMWLVLAADAEGQRNEGEGQACGGDRHGPSVTWWSQSSQSQQGHFPRSGQLPVGCAGAMSSVPC